MTLRATLQARLAERRERGLYRQLKTLEAAPSPTAVVDGRSMVAFSSNDYLGLACHPQVIAAQQEGARLGAGATASHLVNGHLQIHEALQEEIAAATGREAALVFSSGYAANMGTICALIGRGDSIVSDKLNHASLIDGARLSRAESLRFAHSDTAALARQLQRARNTGGNTLVAVDGVYSMDGDCAPLAEIAGLCREHDAWLMVDEAHGFGLMGSEKLPVAGSAAAMGLTGEDAPILMGTLGKAAGNAGAFVAGSRELIDYLVQFARTYIYTTGMPPAVASGALAALQVMQREPERQQRLRNNIDRFRRGAAERGLPLGDSTSPIQPLLLGCDQTVMRVAAELATQGFLVGAIRPPTVPVGTARLRITLSAAHDPAQITALLAALDSALEDAGALSTGSSEVRP
ncbi:8-amino-7-oxononanoate synthase [Microbulbifer flavimaris]|uniref:8-amino-7-oxononanoate synthase n=1 Tax=Microbulbifer flavimaris TaxID=1781068 RepID=A0ABX4HXY6_9GAMM|nr:MULTISPECIES: 8-amino-7-oxononanoate synthase [Microbulbifer]KUJ82810.1 8-amino-7-oxononanoate synthase [Microbulbifer sp. ZGT114]PCO04987.1 8-amino-7-oxononanoate synthase [Microbulbifer flavimaris]